MSIIAMVMAALALPVWKQTFVMTAEVFLWIEMRLSDT